MAPVAIERLTMRDHTTRSYCTVAAAVILAACAGKPPINASDSNAPCPCWTSEDLAEIDGVMWDGYVMFEGYPVKTEKISSAFPYGRRCEDFPDNLLFRSGFFVPIVLAMEWDWMRRTGTSDNERANDSITYAQTGPRTSQNPFTKFKHSCVFKRQNNAPGGGSTFLQQNLTQTEYENCNASLRAFHANSGFCPAGQP